MGMEYKIRFETQEREQLDSLLKSLPHFDEFSQDREVYLYRVPGNSGSMPNAEAQVEKGGLYFCDYGMSQPILGVLTATLVARFGEVQIEEYE